MSLKIQQEGRAVMLGRYITENKTTVRAAANYFGISKSTVHKDVSERLRTEDPELYARVKDILEINKQHPWVLLLCYSMPASFRNLMKNSLSEFLPVSIDSSI